MNCRSALVCFGTLQDAQGRSGTFLVHSRNASGPSGALQDASGRFWYTPETLWGAPGCSRTFLVHSRNALGGSGTLQDAPRRSATLQHAPGRSRSGTFRDAPARSGTTPEMILGTFQQGLVQSETLRDASGTLQMALNGFRELGMAQLALDGCRQLWTVHLVNHLSHLTVQVSPAFQSKFLLVQIACRFISAGPSQSSMYIYIYICT